MPSSTHRTFSDPDAFHASIRAERVDGVITERGRFRAELTRVDFERLWMQRADENLPRVLSVLVPAARVGIVFATDQGHAALHLGGTALSYGDIVALGSRLPFHYRSATACRWGSVSLTQADLAAAGETLVGRELAPPSAVYRVTPSAASFSRLSALHEAAAHLATAAPDILAAPEVARAIEQALIEAMVRCLTDGDPVELLHVHRHRTTVMRRLEAALEAKADEPLYITELCAAVGVSYPTLRACCQAHLGMSPKRYLLLRRMNLARRALRRADAGETNVTEVATGCGFWELGRFSVAYRSLFGESPSATLRRPAEGPSAGDAAGSPLEFTKSA